MIRDTTLMAYFILISGIGFPFLSDIIHYHNYSIIELLGSGLYFFLISFLISLVCGWIIKKIRGYFTIDKAVSGKIITYNITSASLAFLVTLIFVLGWLKISKEQFGWNTIVRASFVSSLFSVIYSLGLETLLLTRERQLDFKIVHQLDKERANAELSALNNELDPHFMFNSLTTLSHLISTDVHTAHLFNQKLAQVYKYILINKNRELISLQDEIEFIEDYLYLLKLRHDDKLIFELRLDRSENHRNMVLPCALQVLVENAIKHNAFSKSEPLQIKIQQSGSYIKIMNNVNLKSLSADSTHTGLKNLSNRYKLICNKDITIEKYKNYFIVKLPLIFQ